MKQIMTDKGYVEYQGQYADKYYFLGIKKVYTYPENDLTAYTEKVYADVYDSTVGKTKTLRVRKNETVRINNQTLSIYKLNG